MRLRDPFISVATILTLSAAPAWATPKGGPTKTTGPSAPKASAPKTSTTHGKAAVTTTQGPKTTTTHGPKTTTTSTHGSPKSTSPTTHGGSKADATGHGNAKKTSTTTTSTSTGTSTTTGSSTGSTSTGSGTTTTTTAPETLNPIAQKISANKGLSPKMATLLPSNLTLNEASKGFKNQGQFIAALHVSQNLGIPFADLKQAMTGIRPIPTTTTTTTGGTASGTTSGTTSGTGTTSTSTTSEPPQLLSLGGAIKKLKPGADAAAAETKATTQATADLSSK